MGLTWVPRPIAGVTGAYFLQDDCFNDVYGPEERGAIEEHVEIVERLDALRYRASSRTWPGVEVLFASWGMVPVDGEFLRRFPDLKAVFYGAGSIRHFATEEMWRRGVRVTSAAAANAVPVAEYALSQILFAAKQGWRQAREFHALKEFPAGRRPPGGYRSTVGLLALGMVGRKVAELLRPFDFDVIAYDPHVPPGTAEACGAALVALDDVFARSDIVSCHLPSLPETARMLRRRHFAAMRRNAAFINTGRGEVVDEAGLIGVLAERPDLAAILDVTAPEPPVPDSPLFSLPNVVLTPHIAGSLGRECRRMGALMAEELVRYLANEPMLYEIDAGQTVLRA